MTAPEIAMWYILCEVFGIFYVLLKGVPNV